MMANDLFLIPLQNVPQRFEIELYATTYIIENRWNAEGLVWFLDWYDGTGKALVMGMPLVAGVNLAEAFPQLPPGVLAVITDGNEFADPTLTNLGVESNLYYLSP